MLKDRQCNEKTTVQNDNSQRFRKIKRGATPTPKPTHGCTTFGFAPTHLNIEKFNNEKII